MVDMRPAIYFKLTLRICSQLRWQYNCTAIVNLLQSKNCIHAAYCSVILSAGIQHKWFTSNIAVLSIREWKYDCGSRADETKIRITNDSGGEAESNKNISNLMPHRKAETVYRSVLLFCGLQ